jgi:dethiobiotin synthase
VKRIFISGAGTGVGKTWVSRSLARALARRGDGVAAIKPIETGCAPDPLDAIALARACRRPELARVQGLYRAREPLSPWAATLEGALPLVLDALVASTEALLRDDFGLVEGVGGLWVPLDGSRVVLDFARALGTPIVFVARDELGVLSHVLAAHAALEDRELAACVLTPHGVDDASRRTNWQILSERLSCPVVSFESAVDDDDALADSAQPVLEALGW